ncbi:MAG: cellulase family glycosylhydrolase [Pseudomonadota bacterium]
MRMMRNLVAAAGLAVLIASVQPAVAAMPMLHTEGRAWVDANGQPVTLKGLNLGNWLINEFWMMGEGVNGVDDECKLEATLDRRFGYAERERLMQLFRDNWITSRDWDVIASYGFNLVRLPFNHSVVEDEQQPGKLRADAWRYLDLAVAEAGKRGIYVVIDLHGAAGRQGWLHHSGCAGKNAYWASTSNRSRTAWLWREIATRYQDNPAVLGYSVLNEPWGVEGAEMAQRVIELYQVIRAADPNHVVILPGHNKSGIDAYGKPSAHGLVNVAFEIHPYPGHFSWGKPGLDVHRNWLRCGPGKTVCEWDARMRALDAALLIGEFQPWAALGPALSAKVTRATYDTYAHYGWAATAWSYKLVTLAGGQGKGTWGLVTNAPDSPLPGLDFNTASVEQIERLFKAYASVRYEHQPGVREALLASDAPPFP